MDRLFSAGKKIFEAFIQDGPAFLLSRCKELLRNDAFLILSLLTHGNLAVFHRLMKYEDPIATAQVHPTIQTCSYKCAAGLKTLLVDPY